MTTFFEEYHHAFVEAEAIVADRDREGRNAAVSVKDQFESTDFVLGIIRMKIQRARSYLAAGNYPKFREEMLDCANYSIFSVVFEKPTDSWPPKNEDGSAKTAGDIFEAAKYPPFSDEKAGQPL